MSKVKKENGQIIENIEVKDVAAEGKSIARYNDKVIFIDNAAPGDIIDIKIIKSKKKFSYAVPIKFHSYSSLREEPFCEHFGVCGGCKWQHINYNSQLGFKTKEVKDALERIGKIHIDSINSILGSKETRFYRNKLEYTFSNKRWLTNEEIKSEDFMYSNALGFHIPGRFDKVLDIKHCHLQQSPSNEIRLELKRFVEEKGFTFFDLRNQSGFLRNLIIRTSSTGQVMVIVQFYEDNKEGIAQVMEYLKSKFTAITSLNYIVNSKANDTIHDQEVICYHGLPYIQEQMEDLIFHVGPKSFYQTNSQQAYELYKIVRDFAGLTGKEVVYDLYTGTGTIANFLARDCKQVIGIEYVPMAIEDSKTNSAINSITNTTFFAGDMKDILNADFLSQHPRPDVIVTDPPRAGMHEDVVTMLLNIAADKIVYVSCNPATQARDLASLDAKYEVKAVQPVDMFPHTQHVENVVLLELRKAIPANY